MAEYLQGAAQVRQVLAGLFAFAAIWWSLFWIIRPARRGWFNEIDKETESKFYGTKGAEYYLQVLPTALMAVTSLLIIALRSRTKPAFMKKKSDQAPKMSFWKRPVVVKSPMGMVTVGETVFVVFIFFLMWYYLVKTVADIGDDIDRNQMKVIPPLVGKDKWQQKFLYAGHNIGKSALIPVILLWLPVSRSSPILRACGIAYDRAVKYHTWLAYLSFSFLIPHGLSFLIYYPLIGETYTLWSWDTTTNPAVLPGVIALSAGLLMLGTAWFRRTHFNLFFRVHHLYFVFLIFFTFHYNIELIYVAIPVLLFFIDRLMRMVQSTKAVDVLSTKVLPCGAIELKFSKPQGLAYHALSLVYVQLPSLSKVEWHPFSVTSSPLDQTNQMSILVKPSGDFTRDLHAHIHTKEAGDGKAKCPFSFQLGVEGPYGDESDFFLNYRSLVLIAGGIGVTPFLSILRDLLHRHRLQQPNLPSSVQLILCVRDPKELSFLDTLDPKAIIPNYEELKLDITVHAFITTSASKGQLSHGSETEVVPYTDYVYETLKEPVVEYRNTVNGTRRIQEMSGIVGTGHNGWVFLTVISTFVGYFVIWGTFNETVIEKDTGTHILSLLHLLSIALAVLVFGGAAIFLWTLWEKNRQPSNSAGPSIQKTADQMETAEATKHSSWRGDVTLGKRPNWTELFNQLAKQYQGQNVGVLVSGGVSLQTDVATQCKQHSLSNESNVVFHHHSVSFEL